MHATDPVQDLACLSIWPLLSYLHDLGFERPLALAMLGLALWLTLPRVAANYGHCLHTGGAVDRTTLFQACRHSLRGAVHQAHYPYPKLLTGLIALTLLAGLTTSLTTTPNLPGLQPFPISLHPPWHKLLPLLLTMAVVLVVLAALIDANTGYLPDALTLPLLWLGLVTAWAGPLAPTLPTLHDALAGILLGFSLPWLVSEIYRHWRGVHGLGGGDLKFMAALGAWLGWQALPGLLLLACGCSLAWALGRSHSLKPQQSFPFGPALAAAGLLVYTFKRFLPFKLLAV